MNLVSRFLPLNHVLLDLDVSSKKRLFEQIGLLFENSRQIPRSRVFDALFDREKLGSTGLGYGVAIPHGRIKTLKEPVCAFVRAAAPIAFESPDGQPVNLVFAMLVPEHANARREISDGYNLRANWGHIRLPAGGCVFGESFEGDARGS